MSSALTEAQAKPFLDIASSIAATWGASYVDIPGHARIVSMLIYKAADDTLSMGGWELEEFCGKLRIVRKR